VLFVVRMWEQSASCMCQKGIKTFGEKGRKAAGKELDQLHQRNCFTPSGASDLSPEEKAQAMEAPMFPWEKKDGTMKGRMVRNREPTHEWLSGEDSASPAAALETTLGSATGAHITAAATHNWTVSRADPGHQNMLLDH